MFSRLALVGASNPSTQSTDAGILAAPAGLVSGVGAKRKRGAIESQTMPASAATPAPIARDEENNDNDKRALEAKRRRTEEKTAPSPSSEITMASASASRTPGLDDTMVSAAAPRTALVIGLRPFSTPKKSTMNALHIAAGSPGGLALELMALNLASPAMPTADREAGL